MEDALIFMCLFRQKLMWIFREIVFDFQVGPKEVVNLTDAEFEKLGVVNFGDRARLRNRCRTVMKCTYIYRCQILYSSI